MVELSIFYGLTASVIALKLWFLLQIILKLFNDKKVCLARVVSKKNRVYIVLNISLHSVKRRGGGGKALVAMPLKK